MRPVQRRMYALAARLRAAWCVAVDGDPGAALQALDLGVIMGGPGHQAPTFHLISALQEDVAGHGEGLSAGAGARARAGAGAGAGVTQSVVVAEVAGESDHVLVR